MRRPPDVALLDLLDPRCTLEHFRSLLRAAYPGAVIGIIGAAPEGHLSALAAAGLDDVVTLPASVDQLLYRMQSVHERLRRQPPEIVFGGLVLLTAEGEARLDGHLLPLRAREFTLLRFLVTSPNRVYRREDLAREVWGQEFDGSLRTVDTHVYRLREHLGEFGRRHLQTVRGVGYRFWAPPALPTP